MGSPRSAASWTGTPRWRWPGRSAWWCRTATTAPPPRVQPGHTGPAGGTTADRGRRGGREAGPGPGTDWPWATTSPPRPSMTSIPPPPGQSPHPLRLVEDGLATALKQRGLIGGEEFPTTIQHPTAHHTPAGNPQAPTEAPVPARPPGKQVVSEDLIA